jgi:hypothetical protein
MIVSRTGDAKEICFEYTMVSGPHGKDKAHAGGKPEVIDVIVEIVDARAPLSTRNPI